MKIKKIMYGALLLLAFTLPLTEALKNLALIVFLLAGFYAVYKKEIKVKFDILNILILLMPTMIFIGSYFALDPINTIRGLNSIVTMSFLFIFIRELEWTDEYIKMLLFALFTGFLIALGLGSYKHFYLSQQFLELKSIGHVNHSAIYMLSIFILSLVYLALEFKKLNYKYIIVIVIVNISASLAVFLTGSRAAMYTLLGMVLLFGLYSVIKLNKKVLFFMLSGLIGIGLLFYFNADSYMISKFKEGIFYGSGRGDIMVGFFESWLHHNKLFGIGLNNSFLINLKDYYNNYSISEILSYSHAHNTFMTYLVERGLVGLLLYLAFIFTILLYLVKIFFINPQNKLVIMGIFLWIENFIISFANTTFHHENAILMLIIWAVSMNQPDIKLKQGFFKGKKWDG